MRTFVFMVTLCGCWAATQLAFATSIDVQSHQKLFQKAMDLRRDGAPAIEVEKQLKRVIQSYPKFAPAWFNLAIVFEEAGRTRDAERAYLRATKNRKWAPPYVNLAAIAFDEKDDIKAEYFLRKALQADVWHALANANLANLLRRRGAYTEAMQHAKRALASDSSLSLSYLVLAKTHEALGERKLAVLACEQGLKVAPNDRELKNLLERIRVVR